MVLPYPNDFDDRRPSAIFKHQDYCHICDVAPRRVYDDGRAFQCLAEQGTATAMRGSFAQKL